MPILPYRIPSSIMSLDGYNIDLSAGATSGQVLQYNGTAFIAQTNSATVNIGSAIGSSTPKSVLFIDSSGNLAQNNADFNWDNTNLILQLAQPNITTSNLWSEQLINDTVTTSGVSQQFSPGLNFRYHQWNGSADKINEWFVQAQGLAGSNAGGTLNMMSRQGGTGSFTLRFGMNSNRSGDTFFSINDPTGGVLVGIFDTAEFSSSAFHGFVGTSTNHDFVFRTNNTGRARIDTSGNTIFGGSVSVNQTSAASASYSLDITGTSANGGARIAIANTGNFAEGLGTYSASQSTGTYIINRIGQSATAGNTAEMAFFYNGNNVNTNALSFSFYNTGIVGYFAKNGDVGIGGNAISGGANTTQNATFRIAANNTTVATLNSTGLALNTSTFANYLLDVVQNIDKSLLHISGTGADNGLFVNSNANGASFAAGALRNSGWVAKSTSAEILDLQTTGLNWFMDTGLTVGNTYTPTSVFFVNGAGQITTQLVQTTGSPNLVKTIGAAHTTLTASTEANDIYFNLGRTVQFSTGALTTQRAMYVSHPTDRKSVV